jgi:hypothetical protein
MENKLLMKWEDIKEQFEQGQQEFIEHSIFMAKETKTPQEVSLKLGNLILLKLGIFPSGLIYKIE